MPTPKQTAPGNALEKHTPGPWQSHGATVYEADKWKDGNNLGGQCVALCFQPMADECPSQEQFANADLIARAPDLLRVNATLVEALKHALEDLQKLNVGHAEIEDVCGIIPELRAALALAEGGEK